MSVNKKINGELVPFSTGSTSNDTPIATTEIAGKVRPDGTTITIDANGVISAHGGGGGTTIVRKPTVSVGTYTYNGQPQGPTITWDTGMAENCLIINATKTDAGSYTLTISLKDTSSMIWDDMSISDLTYNYTIDKVTIALPTVTNTSKTYNSLEQSPTISSYDSTKLSVTGNIATNAGNYTVIFSLIDSNNYIMSGTNNIPWTIVKANQTLTLSSNSATLDSSHLTATITVSGSAGSLSTSTSDGTVATASVSGTIITISNVNEKSGTATITITAASTTNYNSATANISVTADFLQIVSFETGTESQIKRMLDAYYAGDLTWAEMGWAIGDKRKIHFNSMAAPNPNSSTTMPAQDIYVVIVAHDETTLETSINGITRSCITVQTRECLHNLTSYNQTGNIWINGDSTWDMSFTKWSNLYLRTYLNNTVWGALQSGDFKNAIKPSKSYRHTAYNTSAVELVTDTLFLPSLPEMTDFPSGEYWTSYYTSTMPSEGVLYPYYETKANRIKYGNNNGVSNGTALDYWTGSPASYYANDTGYWWFPINSLGSSGITGSGNTAFALAPAWAM